MHKRLAEIRRHFGWTQPKMAEQVEVSHRSWQSYERGEIEPSAKILRELVNLGINGHWLLSGDGAMHNPLDSSEAAAVDSSEPPPHQTALRDAQLASLGELGLTQLAYAARGRHEGLWLLLQLVYQSPEGLTFEQVINGIEKLGIADNPSSVALDLELLTEQGLLSKSKSRWCVPGAVYLKSGELTDVAQVFKVSVQLLTGKILRACRRRDGSGFQLNIQIRSAPEEAKDKLERLGQLILTEAKNLEDRNGTSKIHVTVGAAADPV